MWKNSSWHKVTKIFVTSTVAIIFLINVINNPDPVPVDTVAQPASTEVEAEEEKIDPVDLSISNTDSLVVEDGKVLISGEVTPGASLFINKEEFAVNDDGSFESSVNVDDFGENVVAISAKKEDMKEATTELTVNREMTEEEKAAEKKKEEEAKAKKEAEEAKKKAEEEAKQKKIAEEKAKKEEEKKAKEKAEKEAVAKAYDDSKKQLSGSGDTATDAIELKGGYAVFEAEHNGGRNFAVHLQDENGNNLELLINTIGSYSGKTFAEIPSDGDYYLNVVADGAWNFKISQSPPPTLDKIPGTIQGHGDDVVFVDAKSGNYKMTAKHNGERNFVVFLNGSNLLVNTIGSYDGSQRQVLEDTGIYAFVINADGEWSIDLAK